ncbi:Uncharacterised protein [Chryseobacterium indologenes]|nr:hypothetical protein CEQ15_10190 [Chryseobacterium indologenes]VFA41398.1 Uncharacterised protein [Chryseobacterium indologenes]
MIRVYIDWNVMSQMKSGQHSEFFSIISDNEKFLKPYSSSHLGDISASSQELSNMENIDSDLDFISNLTQNYCLFHIEGRTIFRNNPPRDLYIQDSNLSQLLDVLGIEPLSDNLDEESRNLQELLNEQITLFKNTPIDKVFQKSFENPETAHLMRSFLPELEGNYTQVGLLTAIFGMIERMNKNTAYKDLRENLQSGADIKRDQIFHSAAPYELIGKAYKKKGILAEPKSPAHEFASPWFTEISNEYIALDMHGYQEDKISINRGRKQTFRNTLEDAFHTAFASSCDFYITQDQRNCKKANAVYGKLDINTIAMSADDFLILYKKCLQFKTLDFLNQLLHLLKNLAPSNTSDLKSSRYDSAFFFFDYFNVIRLITDKSTKSPFLLLTRHLPNNSLPIFGKEAHVLVSKLQLLLGNDVDNLGKFSDPELEQIEKDCWPGRHWEYADVNIKLRAMEGHLQLYLYPPNNKNWIQKQLHLVNSFFNFGK